MITRCRITLSHILSVDFSHLLDQLGQPLVLLELFPDLIVNLMNFFGVLIDIRCDLPERPFQVIVEQQHRDTPSMRNLTLARGTEDQMITDP